MAKAKQGKKTTHSKAIKSLGAAWLLRWVWGLAVLVSLTGGAVWGVVKLQQPDVLPLKVVRIEGELKNLSRTELEHVVGGVMRGNFFTVNLERIQQSAMDLAWVDQVTIRRVWPDRLQMWVRERVPLARWGKGQLVTGAGVVFKPKTEEMPAGLPRLSGPDGSAPKVVAQYRHISQQVSALELVVKELRMDARHAWTIGFTGGIELKLGKDEIAQRLGRFVRLYPELKRHSDKTVRRIDLRYTNGVAVLWGEASALY
jgi:cell division protein FtsQ